MRGNAAEATPLLGSVNTTANAADENSFDESKTYGHVAGVAFGLNYVIGTGVFSMPFAFYSAGWKISVVMLVIFAILGLITSLFTLEFLARAEGVTRARELGGVAKPVHQISYRKFDFVRASEMFGGLPMKAFTQICVALYCYGALWSYAAVFSSSASTLFFEYALREKCNIYDSPSPSCHLGYYIVVLAFGTYGVIVAMQDISSQKTLQLAMTWYRFLAFGVMLVTVAVSLNKPNTFDPADSAQRAPYVSHANSHVKWAGFGTVFTFSAVALNMQYNIPDYAQAVRNPKGSLRLMVAAILAISTTFYVLVGYLCSLAFGSATIPLSTLNWNDFTGRAGGWGPGDTIWWAVIVKLFVMLFPLLNMLSVYPLVCVTLAGNLANSMPASVDAALKARFSPRALTILFRLLAAVPPIAASMYSGRLSTILNFTGLIGFFLEFVIPTLLHLISARACQRLWGPGSHITPYTSAVSHPAVGATIIVVGCISFVFAAFVTYMPHQANKLFA